MELTVKNRAIILLCAYDSVVLHFTLQALNKTLAHDEMVVIILNGKRGLRSSLVEQVARDWAKEKPNYHIVRPLCAGGAAYDAIKEVLENFEPLKNKEFICKIDDDLIPLKTNWLNNLHQNYLEQEKSHKVGFVTSLINNNCWGFSQLIEIFNKKSEYCNIMNYKSNSGTGVVEAGHIADGFCGTVWEHPYLARWCHEWTLLDIPNFIKQTEQLSIQEIPLQTHYSIGCMFFRKELWSEIETYSHRFDELLIHEYCRDKQLKKFAIMNEPMGHLYYFVQRKPNSDLIPLFAESFSKYWQDEIFQHYPKYNVETQMMIQFEENVEIIPQTIKNEMPRIINEMPRIIKDNTPSLSKKWKKIRQKFKEKLKL